MVNKPLIRPAIPGGVALGGVARIPMILNSKHLKVHELEFVANHHPLFKAKIIQIAIGQLKIHCIFLSFFKGGTWVFPKIRVPQNEWFIRENPIKMDDLKVPLFVETPTCGYSWESTFFLTPCTSMHQLCTGSPRHYG